MHTYQGLGPGSPWLVYVKAKNKKEKKNGGQPTPRRVGVFFSETRKGMHRVLRRKQKNKILFRATSPCTVACHARATLLSLFVVSAAFQCACLASLPFPPSHEFLHPLPVSPPSSFSSTVTAILYPDCR